MQNPIVSLRQMRRPTLLIKAARHGISTYRREKDLRRLTQCDTPPKSAEHALQLLLSKEEVIEDIRRAGDAGYSVRQHVAIMIALMAEARHMLRATLV